MNDILLTISGQIDPEIETKIAHGERPVADYVAMGKAFPADLMDYPAARQVAGWFGQVLEKIGGANLMLAWACFRVRHQYRVLFTDGEQIGIFLALFFKLASGKTRPRHLMITHRISVRKKLLFLDILKLYRQIDIFIVYSTWQQNFIRERWNLSAERVFYTPFMVDGKFFSPHHEAASASWVKAQENPSAVVCSAGLEYRDYPTLVQAVDGMDVDVILAAASPWSKRRSTITGSKLPDNVRVCRLTYNELRELYKSSRFVVLPLEDVDFQAGVTTILEAMAMGKAVICTRTRGQTDIVVEGETGLYIEAGSPVALRTAIQYLLDHRLEAERMGQNARLIVEQCMDLQLYTTRLARLCQ